MARVVVVGGGAAGLVAAWRAATLGHRVDLLEANGRLGVKLRISGGGKCNVTHEAPPKALLAAFAKPQARFLRAAIHAFGPSEVRDLLRREGVDTYVRENGRVFPLDRPRSAGAVVAAFEGLVRRAGVQVCLGARVLGLEAGLDAPPRIRLEEGWQSPDVLILATGGASYPETGTRGEVLAWLAGQGIPTRSWFPALAPIPLADPRPAWEGVALRGGQLRLWAGPGGRKLAAHADDLLFTRSGVSGPAALELSQAVEAARREGAAWLTYAAVDAPPEALDAGLQAEAQRNPRLQVGTWLGRHLPERLVGSLLGGDLSAGTMLKDLSRAGRRHLAALASDLPLGAPRAVPLARGEVAAGGVALDAVDPRTMVVTGHPGLRICGELLDLDGPVGGYNLQAAFSTGYLAGTV